MLESNFEGNRERTKVPHPPIRSPTGKVCNQCVLSTLILYGVCCPRVWAIAFPFVPPLFLLRKFPHERSLSLSEVTVPSAGRQFATAPSGGRRVAREKEERERERERESVCVCESE